MNDEMLCPDDLARHLSRGLPLPLETELLRLPRFTRTTRLEQDELGMRGKDPLLVCLSRTHTWAFWPVRGTAIFGTKDADRFLKLVLAVQTKHPDKPVRGVVLTGGAVAADGRERITKAGHLISRVPVPAAV